MTFNSDVVIGLEIHVELDTKTKLFCSCQREHSNEPNTTTCPICLGHPGSRPLLNKKALDYALKMCLATDCELANELVFSRKSYFYPDMSKNFQITQFELPLGFLGKIKLKNSKEIRIKRIHLEEDPAAIVYPNTMKNSLYILIDYNRAGNPLVEIVTQPDITSPAEAREFLNQLSLILSYLGIFNVEKCTIKADANISIKESGYERVEIKNISGFKEIERALNYEIIRQRSVLRRNGKITQETRGWNEISKTTISLRKKESEDDYGYIIEPDIPCVEITQELVDEIKEKIPELAQQKIERFIKEFGIEETDATVMASQPELAILFEEISSKIDSVLVSRWLRKELLRVVNYAGKSVSEIKFGSKELIELLHLVQTKKISDSTGQKMMELLMEKKFSPKNYVEEKGLYQLGDESELKELCAKVVSQEKTAVKDYFSGEKKALQFLIGKIMAQTKGRADPILSKKLMIEELEKIN